MQRFSFASTSMDNESSSTNAGFPLTKLFVYTTIRIVFDFACSLIFIIFIGFLMLSNRASWLVDS